MKRIWILLSILSVFILLAGCQRPAATVNGDTITKEDLRKAMDQKKFANATRGITLDEDMLRKSALQELIDQKILMQEAERMKISVTEAEVKQEYDGLISRAGKEKVDYALKTTKTTEADLKEVMRATLIKNKLLALNAQPVSDEEAREFYKEHAGSLNRPEGVKIRLIQVSSKENADKIMGEIKGAAFDTVADRLEKEGKAIVSPSSWVELNSLDQDTKNALKPLKPGSVGGPFKGKGGYYIVKLDEKKPAKVMSFEEAKEQIKADIQRSRANQNLSEMLNTLRNQAKIKINL